ncbi:hypothetical protein HanHA300_Chr04g0128631 [Helianthus annuus]|nr:hypothetical protein HanHA300_Chr04g0128631 [Helianthus annuus]
MVIKFLVHSSRSGIYFHCLTGDSKIYLVLFFFFFNHLSWSIKKKMVLEV